MPQTGGEAPNFESPKDWPQILALSTGSLASVAFGMLFSWPSPAIPPLMSDFGFTLEQCSYLSVISSMTSVVASVLFQRLTDEIGRKYTILTMAASQTSAFLLAAFATNIWVFYLSRVMSGLSDACVFLALPTYVGEIATPRVRGLWGNAVGFGSYAGQAIISAVAGYTTIRDGALISLAFPLVFAATFSLMPESPYFLLMKDRKEEARESLKWLRRMQNVEEELKQIEADVQRQLSETGTWKDLVVVQSNRRALSCGVFLRFAQQFSGILVFGVYAEYIFKQAASGVSATNSAIVFLGISALGNLLGTFFINSVGKRRALKYSSALSAIVLASISIFFYVALECPEMDVSDFMWMPLVGMLLFVAVFSVGLGIVPTFILSELFSASIKGKGLCALTITFGLLQTVTSKIFQVMEVNLGMYAPFAFFAACCFVSTFLVDRFVPETKGKTLEEIQQILKANKKMCK